MIRRISPLARLGLAVAAAALGAGAARAESVLDRWASIPVPPPPELQPATVDTATSALLVLDMYATSCNAEQRPTCVPTIPRVRKLLDEARAKKMLVIYGAGLPALNGPTEPTPELARLRHEPTVRGAADKFFGSDLEKRLSDAKIQTVILVGTSADGAILYTSSGAAFRGLKAIVPVDMISSAKPFAELYAVSHLKNTAGTVARNVTLTRSDLITLR